jgi:hypothetical protein
MGIREEPITTVLHDNRMVEIVVSIVSFIVVAFDSFDLVLKFLLVHLIVACDF